ncbi:MAG: hypothetical protein IJ013_01585 [Bacteroidaceae bacterium]|nr:hypothetical protein [Bacteroidaceae bacterium]
MTGVRDPYLYSLGEHIRRDERLGIAQAREALLSLAASVGKPEGGHGLWKSIA